MSKIDWKYYHSSVIVCPYCYHEFTDSWEYNAMLRDGGEDIECEHCEKKFSVCMDVSVDYTSHKIEGEE